MKGRKENTKMRWNVKTAIIALLKRTLLFIFLYTHPFMQFMVLALWSPNRVDSEVEANLSQHEPPFFSNHRLLRCILMSEVCAARHVHQYSAAGTLRSHQTVSEQETDGRTDAAFSVVGSRQESLEQH